jgi:nickel superoxide dismutase
MRKALLVSGIACMTFFASYRIAMSHCEIPCGIYNDKMRIVMLLEDITTVEKSMNQITTLSASVPANVNQVVRWVVNKEEHCNKIQEVVTQYFMTQRVKPAAAGDAAAYKKYVTQLTTLHGILVHAMKAKQTTELAHIKTLRELVDQFAAAYFSAEDYEHLQEHHG